MKLLKRILTGALCAALSLSAAGCGSTVPPGGVSSKDGSTPAQNAAMGRYVETVLTPLPDSDYSSYRMMYQNPDGSFEYFSYVRSPEDKEITGLRQWHSADMQEWKQQDAPWIADMLSQMDGLQQLFCAAPGPDGSIYAVVEDASPAPTGHLFRSTDGKTAEEIVIPTWGKPAPVPPANSIMADSYDGSDPSAPLGQNLNIRGLVCLENGDILIASYKTGVFRYSPTGELLQTLPVSYILNMQVAGQTVYCSESMEEQIHRFDLATGNSLDPIILKDAPIGTANLFLAGETGELTVCNKKGIHRIAAGGGIWETVMNGSLSFLNSPSMEPVQMFSDKNGDFYLFYQSAGEPKLTRCSYDAAVPATPSRVLTVYSLKESLTVLQAITDFQLANPDVMVDYQIAMGESSSATEEDVIRALNTAILNGDGPDVLILDGLPVASYIEKNVLEDLSPLLAELKPSLMSGIVSAYEQNGKTYAIPARFAPSLLIGDKAALDSLHSLRDMLDFEGEKPLFSAGIEPNEFLNDFIYASYPAWVTPEGALDEAKLIEFLETAGALYKKYPVSSDNWGYSTSSGGGMGVLLLGPNFTDYRQGNRLAFFTNVLSTRLIPMVLPAIDAPPTTLRPMLGQSENTFLPMIVAGVNSAGKQKGLASGFVKALLAPEVQSIDLCDGLSVHTASLDKYFKDFTTRVRDESIPLDVTLLGEVSAILQTLDTPILIDPVLFGAVFDGGIKVLNGTATAEQAVKDITKTMALRLAE